MLARRKSASHLPLKYPVILGSFHFFLRINQSIYSRLLYNWQFPDDEHTVNASRAKATRTQDNSNQKIAEVLIEAKSPIQPLTGQSEREQILQ